MATQASLAPITPSSTSSTEQENNIFFSTSASSQNSFLDELHFKSSENLPHSSLSLPKLPGKNSFDCMHLKNSELCNGNFCHHLNQKLWPFCNSCTSESRSVGNTSYHSLGNYDSPSGKSKTCASHQQLAMHAKVKPILPNCSKHSDNETSRLTTEAIVSLEALKHVHYPLNGFHRHHWPSLLHHHSLHFLNVPLVSGLPNLKNGKESGSPAPVGAYKRTPYSGVGRYRCPYPECGYTPHFMRDLRRHMFKHTGDKKHKCDYPGCSFVSVWKTSILQHKRCKHFHAQKISFR